MLGAIRHLNERETEKKLPEIADEGRREKDDKLSSNVRFVSGSPLRTLYCN
jgi:hypothetical protein